MSKQGNLSPNIFVEPNAVELVTANRLINNQLTLPYGQNGAGGPGGGGSNAPTSVNGHWATPTFAFLEPGQPPNYQAISTGQLVQYGKILQNCFTTKFK